MAMAPIALAPRLATMMVSTTFMEIQPSSARATGTERASTCRTSARRFARAAARSALRDKLLRHAARDDLFELGEVIQVVASDRLDNRPKRHGAAFRVRRRDIEVIGRECLE